MSSLCLFTLLALIAPPQDFVAKVPSSPLPQSQDFVGKVPSLPLPQGFEGKIPSPLPGSGLFQIGPDGRSRTYRLSAEQARNLANRDTCYTMRSYIFRRQDGNAPVLVGTTTCTPANVVRPRQVNRSPRLVPAY